jgi:hypothetical protein
MLILICYTYIDIVLHVNIFDYIVNFRRYSGRLAKAKLAYFILN